MRSSLRGLAAATCTSLVAVSLPLVALSGAAADPASGSGVVVNEVKSNPGPDFVELLNASDAPVDITGWRATDDSVGRTPIVITTAETVLEPGEYFTFNPDDAAYGAGAFGLGGNDQITIFLPDGTTVVDEFSWEGIGAPGNHANPSYGRCTDGTGEMVLNLSATPGAGNDCPVVAPTEPISINEVESNGDPVADWVELTNTGATPVDVSGWQLRDGGESNPTVTIPGGTTIAPGGFHAIYTEIPGPGFGLGVDDEVTLYKADGTTVADEYAWSGGHAATTYGRCPDGTGEFRVTTVGTRGGPNACSPIRVNEVVTSGAPDQVEIVNISGAPIDIAGWVVKDNGDADPTTLPAPSLVPAHGHLVVTTVAALGTADSVRLFDAADGLVDSVTWSTEPTPSLGRCADGVGAFKLTESATIGAANECPGVATEPWPGSAAVTASDEVATFNQDASGLAFDPSDPSTLWVAQNKLGTLWKMTKSGSTWVPAIGWSKTPRYSDGTGAPDSEGITVGPDGAVYLASERDNSDSGVSKNAVLRYDADAATGATLNAADEWDLNPLLPTVGANLGLEGITWVPDSFLVDGGFVDQSTSSAYVPAHYPDHGTGLYVVAVEGSGLLYVLALDQTPAVHETAHLVATVDPRLLTKAGPAGVMDVSYDAEQKRLWASCDDSCDGTAVLLTLSDGEFVVEHAYERPAGMPNLNNEGFAVAPRSTCVAGKKEVVWADDGDTDGHSLRSGTFPCAALPTGPTGPSGPTTPAPVAATLTAPGGSVAYGKAISIPVTVAASGTTPSGAVTVSSGSAVLGTATLSGGAATVPVPVRALAPGVHALTVAYAGSAAVTAGSTTATLTVTKAKASVARPAVAPKRVIVKKTRVRLVVKVAAVGVIPTGRITVSGAGLPKRSATLGAGGRAVIRLPAFKAKGATRLTVSYLGDTYVAGDTTQASIRVKPKK